MKKKNQAHASKTKPRLLLVKKIHDMHFKKRDTL